MLKSITVENYRGFRSKTKLELRPLTILLGRNSSGKSSLTRLIPLLQQSLERQSSSPILWSSESVDFGNIADVITHGDEKSELRIGIQVTATDFHRLVSRAWSQTPHLTDLKTAEFDYIMRLSADGVRTQFDGIEISFAGQTLAVDWTQSGMVTGFKVDGRAYELGSGTYSADTTSLFPEISRVIEKEDIVRSTRAPIFYDAIRPALESIIHGRTASDKIDYVARRLSFIPRSRALEALVEFPNVVKRKLTDDKINLISDLSMINSLPRIMQYLDFTIAPSLLRSAYIGPSRATGKRFDRIQELAVERLESSGENAAMYFYSLSEAERASFNDLLIRACGHKVMVEASGPGHVSIKIGRANQPHFENIADVGFGFSQLIPVVAQLHAVRERNLGEDSSDAMFAVEQPELHLHPAMQANLADLFVSAIEADKTGSRSTTMLVETHSETLVSQLGILIADKRVAATDVAIYFVSKDEMTGDATINEMRFDEDGLIANWPVGFFSAQ